MKDFYIYGDIRLKTIWNVITIELKVLYVFIPFMIPFDVITIELKDVVRWRLLTLSIIRICNNNRIERNSILLSLSQSYYGM